MATRRRSSSTREHRDYHSSHDVAGRLFKFGGPFAVAPVTLGLFLLLRWTGGTTANLVLYSAGAMVFGGGLTLWVWMLSKHRDLPIRVMLAAIAVLATLGAVITLAVGAQGWWVKTYIVIGSALAVFWVVSRVDALRKDPREEEAKGDDDDAKLRKELGLDGVKLSGATVHRDDDGDITRIEIDARNKQGTTAANIQRAVPGLENLAANALGPDVPIGRSRAVPNGPADTRIVIITKDVLKGMVRYPGPSRPGASITEPLRIGVYEDQEPEEIRVAGGHDDAQNPASSGFMGMTRSGKTAGAHVQKAEKVTRNNVALVWLDTVKGAQTAEPLADAFSLMVATDDAKATRKALTRLKALVKSRTTLLGSNNYVSWCDEASYKLQLPFLDIQFEEADDLLKDPQTAEDVVYIASKGLSAGIRINVSLQRMDANSAPSGLRFNLGLVHVYGCGDSYSAGFLLSDPTVAAGAHPENWKASKPGYHYTEGLGVDEARAPVLAKSYYMTNDELRAHFAEWAPRMMPLHPTDVATLNGDDGWFNFQVEQMHQQIDEWRRNIVPGHGDAVVDGVEPVVEAEPAAGPVPQPRTPAQATTARPEPQAPPVDDDDDPVAVAAEQVRQEMDEVPERHPEAYEGVEPEVMAIDPSRPTPKASEFVSWGDNRPAAATREQAIETLHRALANMLDRPENDNADEPDEHVEREDEHSVTFGPGALFKRYPFRSRPWFSDTLKALLAGDIPLPEGMSIERVRPGVYRLCRALARVSGGGDGR